MCYTTKRMQPTNLILYCLFVSQMVYELFKEVMSRPRVKTVFDQHHPDAHVQKKEVLIILSLV